MKLLLIVFLTLGSTVSFAGGISNCIDDKYMSARITMEIPPEEKIVVFNHKEEEVGALKVSYEGDLVAMYLCGENSGYFHVKGTVDELILDVNKVSIYNDEYEIDIGNTEYDGDIISLDIAVSGGNGLDYDPFEASLMIRP